MYTLIIWSYLCTAIDPNCPTGDFIVFGTYESERVCMKARKAWKASGEYNSGVCYLTTKPTK